MKIFKILFITILGLSSTIFADSGDVALFTVNNTWMLVATILVFIMHLGFATL